MMKNRTLLIPDRSSMASMGEIEDPSKPLNLAVHEIKMGEGLLSVNFLKAYYEAMDHIRSKRPYF